ncbi:OmpA family protein [Marinomonas dokdonensis]|uniref:OmpA family protein n=1 Tax=Marinomonas dokdonensis TaxID=328224 RepID=UPI0040557B30
MTTLLKTIGLMSILTFCSLSFAESLYSSNPQTRLLDSDRDGVIDARDRCPNTKVGARVDNVGCTAVTEKLFTVQLNVLFDSGKTIVKPRFYPELKELADFLNANPSASVVIEGHTDNVGSDVLNKSLSQQRANAIADVLVDSFRIREFRVKGIGFGETRPIESNDTEAGREKNRRVVAEVFAKEQQVQERWTIYSVDKNTTYSYTTRY